MNPTETNPMFRLRPSLRRFLARALPAALVLFALSVLAVLIGLAAPRAARGEEAAPLEVVASILPIADFAREVGGPRVHVSLLVPPGQNPHSFALRPSQAVLLSRARLLFLNGLGLEFWAEPIVSALDPRRVRVLRLGEGLGQRPAPAGATEDGGAAEGGAVENGGADHGHGGINPHVWLDPVLAMEMVRQIRDALAAADPPHAAEYGARAEGYLAELAALDAEYRQALAPLPARTFIAFHAGYDHLAARYGLTAISVLKGIGEAEPSPARVAEVIRTAHRLNARAIFAEPQYPLGPARLIAEEAGIGLAILDPLGLDERVTYLSLMRENLKQIVTALR